MTVVDSAASTRVPTDKNGDHAAFAGRFAHEDRDTNSPFLARMRAVFQQAGAANITRVGHLDANRVGSRHIRIAQIWLRCPVGGMYRCPTGKQTVP